MMMSVKQIRERIAMVYDREFLNRIEIQKVDEEIVIYANVHGLHKNSSRIFLNNLVNICQFHFTLVVIHGYNHATVLKDMINSDAWTNSRILEKAASDNSGRTNIKIAAAA